MAMAEVYCLLALLALMCAMESAAQAPPPALDCSIPFNDLMPCIEFVNSNSSAPPSAACCTAFSATQKRRPECLCQLQQAFADPATAPGNATRATEIPLLCKVSVDYSECPALLGLAPVPAPAHPPVPPVVPAPRHAPVSAPVAAPGPAPRTGKDYDCTNSINELSSCLGFVSGDGKGGPPKDCCTAIGSVQGREPVCLCQLLAQAADGAQYGINATLAKSLPTLCHVPADTSRCPTLLNSPISSGLTPSPSPSPTHPPSPPFSIVPAPAHAPVPSPPSPTTPAPGPAGESVDCSNEYALLQSCFAYVMANDTTPPSPECCTSLGGVVANKPVCLCQLLQTVGSGDPATAGINATRALGLSTVCKVAADVGMCPALLGQPVSSPVPSSPLTAESPGSPTGDGYGPDGQAASPAPSRSGAASARLQSVVVMFAAIFCSFASALHSVMNSC